MSEPATNSKSGAIRFEPCVPSDADEIATWFQSAADVAMWASTGLGYPVNAPRLRSYLESLDASADISRAFKGIEAESGQIVGYCEIHEREPGIGRLARLAVSPFGKRGKGYGRTMTRFATDLLFQHPQIHRVELEVFSHNRRAIMIYEGMGFVIEGCRREAIKVNTEYWDSYLMSILRRERRP